MPVIQYPSDWLKIDVNVNDGDEIVFLDTGTFDEEKGSWNFNVSIAKDGKVVDSKKFTLNKTNFSAVSELYGNNSDDWMGKSMVVRKIKQRKPGSSQMVDSILLEAPAPVPASKK